jgi:GT2 family glycosyltransferase
MSSASSDSAVAVVIPSWRSRATLDAVLAALQPQLREGDEVVVVDSSADGHADDVRSRYPWTRVIALETRTYPGAARNHGAAETTAPLLAFLDADTVPNPDWLEQLRDGLGGAQAAGGSIVNATTGSRVATAAFLLEYDRWAPEATTSPDSLLAGNLIVRRAAFEQAGGMPAGRPFGGEDTIFTARLVGEGQAGFVPSATVSHHGPTGSRTYLTHQFEFGRTFRFVVRRSGLYPQALGWRWLAPVTGTLRWAVVMRRTARRRPSPGLGILLLMTIGIAAWALGLAFGSGTYE